MTPSGERFADGRPLMRSIVRVESTMGPDKVVHLPAEPEPVVMGVRDELAQLLGAPADLVAHASTLDYVVAAAGACLVGTLRRALTARGVTVAPADLAGCAIGDIVVVDGVPVIRSIDVAYELSGTRPEHRAAIERAHAVHHRGCAVSRSLEGSITITTALSFVEP